MAENLSVIGIANALFEASKQIARLRDIDAATLTLLEGALLLLHGRDQLVSIDAVHPLVSTRLSDERIEAIFYILIGAGVLSRHKRDKRGMNHDQFTLDIDNLRQIIRNSILLMQWIVEVESETEPVSQAKLIATLPETLPLEHEIRQRIPSLATTLHRLITNASKEIIILNPFFEQEGFNRLGSALLAAAQRGVMVTIITRQLSNTSSINYKVLRGLFEKSRDNLVGDQFQFYEYQQLEDGFTVLTSHAKVMLVDGRTAYIGSANLTEHGMARNIEIGIMLENQGNYLLKKILQTILADTFSSEIYF